MKGYDTFECFYVASIIILHQVTFNTLGKQLMIINILSEQTMHCHFQQYRIIRENVKLIQVP